MSSSAKNFAHVALLTDYGLQDEFVGVMKSVIADIAPHARITPIYEGTNGIQAADLVGRKLSLSNGAAFADLIADLKSAEHPRLVALVALVAWLLLTYVGPLVRVLDPHSRRDCLKMGGFIAALFAMAVLYIVPYLALRRTGYVALARISMHNREHIVILRPGERGILLHTMYYNHEIRKVDEFRTDLSLVKEKELNRVFRLADSNFIFFVFGSIKQSVFKMSGRCMGLKGRSSSFYSRGEMKPEFENGRG